MKEIKLWYTDFYDGFNPEDHYLHHLLKKSYKLILDPKEPDFLLFSCYGKDFLKFPNTVKIYYTGENLLPDFNLCDYGIGFHFLNFGERYLRFPNFALLRDQFEALTKPKNFTNADLKNRPYFCNFIYANARANPARDEFFHELNQNKKVMSPGRHLQNCELEVGERFAKDWMYTKLNFQSKCKFSIAFENSSSPGYTTEKIMHAFNASTVPIYWGNPQIIKDFNPDAFINCHEFSSFSEVFEEIKKLDENDELFLKKLNAPPFKGNKSPHSFSEEVLNNFFRNIFDQDKNSAKRRPAYGTTKNYEKEIIKAFENQKSTNKLQKLKFELKKRFR